MAHKYDKCPEARPGRAIHCEDCDDYPNCFPPLKDTEEEILTNKLGGKNSKIDTRYDLIPFECLESLAIVLAEGAQKYAPNNWHKVPPEDHYNHMMNHLVNDRLNSDQSDTEDLDHALCRMIMYHYTKKYLLKVVSMTITEKPLTTTEVVVLTQQMEDRSKYYLDMEASNIRLRKEVDRLEKEISDGVKPYAEAMAKQQSLIDSLKVELEYAVSKNEVYAKIEQKNQLLQAVVDARLKVDDFESSLNGVTFREIRIARDKYRDALTALREFEKGEKNGK